MTTFLNSKIAKAVVGSLMVVAFMLAASSASALVLTRSLSQGMSGQDVKDTQVFLNSTGYSTIATSGAGSAGMESTYFGAKTKAAVKLFQAHWGFAQVGRVGPMTSAKIAELTAGSGSGTGTAGLPAGCLSAQPTQMFSSTTGAPCVVGGTVVTGSSMVALALDNPAAGTVPDAANANFTKFTVSAGATPVSITTMYVTRYGLSVNSDVENIKILDENMVQVSSSGSLNSNNKAQVAFSPALTVPAGTVKSFYIRAGIVNGTTGGKTVALGIDSASDIIGTSTFGGTFPVKGNYMGTVLLDIGTVTIDEDGTVTDSQPDGGDTDVTVNKFNLTAGSTEDVTVKQISVERQGTAAASDVVNIELYNVSTSQTIATVATWDANGMATFNNLNMVIAKGETKRFEIRVDIIGGASLTVNADLTDGSDVYVQVTGNTYGFFISPTNSMTNGQGASDQTVQSGTLTITRATTSPVTGNISSGSDKSLAIFDFQVQGEPMKITSLEVNVTFGSMVYGEVTNIKLTDATTGMLLAGPKDMTSSDNVTFTDVIFLPVGTTKVKVTANIATTVSASDTIRIDLDDPSTEITTKGLTSNDSVTPSPASVVSGNTQTVQAATLTAVTNTTPAARRIVKGQQDFVFATVSLSAANSGEDVNVSAVVVESTANVAADDTNSGSEDLDNVEIWADLTSASSARGDVYETKVSDTKQFAGTNDGDAVLSFNINPIITVARNATVGIAVVADLSSSAVATDTFAVSLDTDSGDVTANGKDTGSSVTLTPTGAGQAMTVAAAGTLTLTLDSSSPLYTTGLGMLLDTSTEQTVAVFKLAANNTENLNVDSMKITDDGTNGNDVVAMYKFYNGATLLGSITPDGSGNAEVFLLPDQLVIPANDYKLVTVKAIMNDIDGTGFVNADSLEVTVDAAGDIDTTGVASGSAVDSTQTSVDAATFTVYEAYPTLSFLTGTDTSDGTVAVGDDITLGSLQLVAKIKAMNPGNKDVTFQSGDSNLLSIQVTVTGDDTDTANETITLKDQYGTTLDTGTISSATGTTQIDFDMSSVGATVGTTIPAGATRYYYVYADTSDLEDATSTIQISLDDTAADVTFGINGSGAYTEGDVVNVGDPQGPLVNYPN